MNIYNLGKVALTTDGVSFNIIGVYGRPLVSFEFKTQKEAEAAHEAMQAILATTKLITTHRQSGD
jgi:hypothetical protein